MAKIRAFIILFCVSWSIGFSQMNTERILTIGRIVSPKGYDFAIKASAILKEKNIGMQQPVEPEKTPA